MARRLQLLLLLLTCFSVGAEVLLATPGLPSVQTDQVHDCGPEDARLAGESDAAETDPVDALTGIVRAHPVRRVATASTVAPARNGREGMRRHRWCRVDLN